MKDTTWVIDTEGDGFNPTKFHCLSAGQDTDNISSTSDPDRMRGFLESAETLIGHNIQRADVIWMERILGVSLADKRIIDTLPLSWALFPAYDRHGLYDWGDRFGIPKVDIQDWVNLPVEDYIERCEQDVKINLALWDLIWKKLVTLYGNNLRDINRYIDYLSFKMKCAAEQEENKWRFDLRNAHEALTVMMKEREIRVNELSRAMPKVPIRGTRQAPKRMFNKEGSLTKLGESWFEQLKELGLPESTAEIEFIKGYDEPNPGSQEQLKNWLFSLGWKPDVVEIKKDKDTKETREVPKINKDKQKGGGVSDSVKKLFDKEPALASLDGLSILNHRIPLLSGFISNSDGGYLAARVAGLTNTLRFIHAEIVNLPKVGLPFADAIRGSLIAGGGYKLVGSDMSSLEDRLKQHYIYPLDPEYVKTMLRDDYDPHLFLAERAGAITREQYNNYVSGVDKSIKPIRDIYKNGNYSMQYGAYPPRVAITCGISLKEAKQLFEDYWKLNWSVREAALQQRTRELGEELWLWNPVSRFWYSLRSEKDVFSTLVQGTAAYVFDEWLKYVMEETKHEPTEMKLIAQFHDEWVFRCKEDGVERLEAISFEAVNKLNKLLCLNRELDIGVQSGDRYSDIH
jgi:hypothetical protein